MRGLNLALAALSLVTLSACYERETVAVDPHRQWWGEHHRGDVYDRERADREHREYCQRSYDRSCEGWR